MRAEPLRLGGLDHPGFAIPLGPEPATASRMYSAKALRRRLTAELAEEKFAGQIAALAMATDLYAMATETLRVARESLARLARTPIRRS